MILLTLTPAIGGFIELPRPVVMAIFAAAVLLLFVGAGVGVFGRDVSPRALAVRGTDDAVGPLLAWGESGGARGAAVEAAVTLLYHARYPTAVGTQPTWDPREMSDRLGEKGTALVRSVEAELQMVEGGISPVFGPVAPGSAD
jgi:hypothetical protein